MPIEPQLVNQRIRPAEKVRILWTIQGDANNPIAVWREPQKELHHVNGKLSDCVVRSQSKPNQLTIAPNGNVQLETTFEPTFSEVYRGAKAIETFTYSCELTLIVAGVAVYPAAPTFDIEMDFRATEVLFTPAGAQSLYIVDGGRVLYVSRKSRSYEERTRLLNVDTLAARVLDEKYLVAANHVFRDGRPLKGVDASRFRVLSPVYATDNKTVFTSYGNAKVADPVTFEALDMGDSSIFEDPGISYRAGYGRDCQFVYYFDESTSTPHAVRLRGCKSPAQFVALGRGYGKDDQRVYQGATRIVGAAPSSFTLLAGWYSQDERSVFFGTTRLENADVATFTVLPSSTPFNFNWAKDANRYYQAGMPQTKEAYDCSLCTGS